MSAADVAAWTDPVPSLPELGAVHFVGIGGAGMSGIARILLARGVRVSGSDRAGHPDAAGACARSAPRSTSATTPANLGRRRHASSSPPRSGTTTPSWSAARERGLRVLPRAEALAAVMAGRRSVAVAGTHGKTTTTSMLTVAVQACGVDPSFAIGGDLNESGSNAHHGRATSSSPRPTRATGRSCCCRPYGGDRHQRRGRPPRQLRRPRRRRGRLRPVPRAPSHPDGFVVVCADDPGAAPARRRRPRRRRGCAPTARPRTPTCG